jgi:hypothetical protein
LVGFAADAAAPVVAALSPVAASFCANAGATAPTLSEADATRMTSFLMMCIDVLLFSVVRSMVRPALGRSNVADVACYLRGEKPEHCDEARRIDESGDRVKQRVLGFHFSALEWISAM